MSKILNDISGTKTTEPKTNEISSSKIRSESKQGSIASFEQQRRMEARKAKFLGTDSSSSKNDEEDQEIERLERLLGITNEKNR